MSVVEQGVHLGSHAGAEQASVRGIGRGWAWRFFRSELRLIGGRRRNQVGLLVLAAVPVIIAVTTRLSSGDGRGPDFFGSITSNGLFVALAALTVELPMFLPMAVAMLSGDAIAGEANTGTLRYLLTVPVSRTRLLLLKLASLCFGALWGVVLVAGTGVVVGVALFGTGPMITLSGSEISFGAALWRLTLIVLYLAICLSAVAAVGLFVSTLTEQPIAVTIAVMVVVVLSFILEGVPQLEWLHPWLIQREWLAFGDLLRDPLSFDGVGRGVGLAAAYVAVFGSLAWARFTTKDITS